MSVLKELRTPMLKAESIHNFTSLGKYFINIIKDNLIKINLKLMDFIKLFEIRKVNCRGNSKTFGINSKTYINIEDGEVLS